jgi:hypothetical protein
MSPLTIVPGYPQISEVLPLPTEVLHQHELTPARVRGRFRDPI